MIEKTHDKALYRPDHRPIYMTADDCVNEKREFISKIDEIKALILEMDSLGRISVRRITRVYDEGVIVSKKFHRSWIMPGDDASKADVMSKAVADKIHTVAVKDAYDAEMAGLSESQ